MITFLIIIIAYSFVSSIIAVYRNTKEIAKAAAAIREISLPGVYPILMPVYGRPHYLKEVLNALARVQDIDKTVLVISQDGSNPEVTALIKQIDFTRTIIIQHTRPFLGILACFWDSLVAASTNIHFLLKFVFKKTNVRGAIVLENDIVPSVDFYNYFQWAFNHVLDAENVLSVTGFNIDSRVVPQLNYHPQNYPYELVENRENDQGRFCSWSWGITRDKWQKIRKSWSFTSWDLGLDKLQRKMGLISYKPVLGRVRNIGMHGGINFTEADDNPKWRDVFISGHSYDYRDAPRLHEKDEFVKLSYPEEHPQPHSNEKKRTRRNRLWLLTAVVVMTVVELFILLFNDTLFC